MLDLRAQQEFFALTLQAVVSNAYAAAGYVLEESAIQMAGGLFRYRKRFEDGMYAFIVYQHLPYPAPMPSRFRVTLVRTNLPNANLFSRDPRYNRRTLSALVVQVFGVNILPAADYWWQYSSVTELGSALAEAGHLVAGFGIPWLAGTLLPPDRETTQETSAVPSSK